MSTELSVVPPPTKHRGRPPGSKNRPRCPVCKTGCVVCIPPPAKDTRRDELLAARCELVRELIKASRAALLQAEAHLDELELSLTPEGA